jgi:hypothetical protein
MDHYEEDTDETAFVIDDALSVIVLVQGLPSHSVAARDLRAAVTLMREARSRLARLVADARDEETSWAEIGHILGTGRLIAACRYGPFVRRRRTPLALD